MKKIIISLLCLLSSTTFFANTTDEGIPSSIKNVTVFTKGAQVFRTAKTNIPSGITELKFTNISAQVDKNSIQVKADGDFIILSVSHQLNYFEEPAITPEVERFQAQHKTLTEQIEDEKTIIGVLKAEENMILSNQKISGTENGVLIEELRKAAEFYRSRLTDIRTQQLAINRKIKNLQVDINKINQQLQEINAKRKKTSTSEILVKVQAKTTTAAEFSLSYLVNGAGWFPNYDIRVKDVKSPIQLMYKANVYQNTGEDWKDIKMTLSTGNPSQSGTKPTMYPWRLGFYQPPVAYRNNYGYENNVPTYGNNRTVSGRITDSTGEVLIGATIQVVGTAVGTVTDFDGNYSLTLPDGYSQISVSYTGFNSQQVNIGNGGRRDITLQQGVSLDEVVVTAYGSSRKDKKREQLEASKPVPVQTVQNTTSVEFKIDLPYSIPSNGKRYTVQIEEHQLPAYYEYYCAPKLDKDAFLTAEVTGWETYNLLTGEANLFFEGTYIGKSLLNMESLNDTLSLSLGRDKNIVVNRTKKTDYQDRQFIGNKKTDSRAWEIEIRNKKNLPVNIVIQDQFPVSITEDIEVKHGDYKGAELDKDTGILTWELEIAATSTEKLMFDYSVKYPKKRRVNLE